MPTPLALTSTPLCFFWAPSIIRHRMESPCLSAYCREAHAWSLAPREQSLQLLGYRHAPTLHPVAREVAGGSCCTTGWMTDSGAGAQWAVVGTLAGYRPPRLQGPALGTKLGTRREKGAVCRSVPPSSGGQAL